MCWQLVLMSPVLSSHLSQATINNYNTLYIIRSVTIIVQTNMIVSNQINWPAFLSLTCAYTIQTIHHNWKVLLTQLYSRFSPIVHQYNILIFAETWRTPCMLPYIPPCSLLDSLILIIGALASHLFVVNMFSGHNALNMPLHSQTNHQADHKTSGDKLCVSSAT